MTQIADSLTWLKGRHTLKMGADLRWERLNVDPAAVADRLVHVQQPVHRPARRRQHRHAVRQLPARPGAAVLDRSAAGGDSQPRALPGVLHPGRLAAVRSRDGQRRPALHAELSVDRGERPGRGLQPRDPAARVSRPGRPAARRRGSSTSSISVRASASSAASPTRRWSATGYGLVWIEMAGITTPFTTPVFPFLQTVSQRTLDNITPAFTLANGPSVAPIPLTPDAGLGQGVFSVDRDLGSGYVQQWNASVQRELTSNIVGRGRLRRLEDHPRRHSGHEPESADRRAAGAGHVAAAARAQSVLRHHSALVVARRSDDLRSRSCSSRIREYTTVSLYRNNVGTTIYHGVLREAGAALLATASRISSATRARSWSTMPRRCSTRRF